MVRLGFLGVGWIGRHRLQAMHASGLVEVVALADPSPAMIAAASMLAPNARVVADLADLFEIGLDGIVIATPSALHAAQAVRALEHDLAVFCQKPLGRTAIEVGGVVAAARAHNRLLGVDFSYRCTAGMHAIRELLRQNSLGHVFSVDLVFHNAYGPDKAWFYDPGQSGGGCVMDLGVHLVDLALWALDFPAVTAVTSRLLFEGAPVRPDQVEDFALISMELSTGATVRLACSWRLHAGCDAVISASFYGRDGGARLRNVGGSFYDFTAERYQGTARSVLSAPPDDWGGRAAVEWAQRLAAGQGFSDEAERFVDVARVLDDIYQAAGSPSKKRASKS